jgi:hypothetical protein
MVTPEALVRHGVQGAPEVHPELGAILTSTAT